MKSVSLVQCLVKSGSFLNCSCVNAEINEWDHRACTRLVNVCVFFIDFFFFSSGYCKSLVLIFYFGLGIIIGILKALGLKNNAVYFHSYYVKYNPCLVFF